MSPEQVADATAVDARTDLYALGAILYRVLTGRAPCTGTALGILSQLSEGQPPLPVAVASGVPEPLEAVCVKAMARPPDARYPTATELVEDLAPGRAASSRRSPPATSGPPSAAGLARSSPWPACC